MTLNSLRTLLESCDQTLKRGACDSASPERA
jgi:hypothetical protein